jgi:succinate dehydrogenase hydrophobic anchor subunit
MDQPGKDPDRGTGQVSRQGSQLKEVRAAQLRTRTVRWAIGKVAFGMLFLIGAMSYTVAPDSGSKSTALWMAMLVVLSTLHIGLGLRALTRVRQRAVRLWFPATLAWGLLATVMLRILVDR